MWLHKLRRSNLVSLRKSISLSVKPHVLVEPCQYSILSVLSLCSVDMLGVEVFPFLSRVHVFVLIRDLNENKRIAIKILQVNIWMLVTKKTPSLSWPWEEKKKKKGFD